MRNFYMLKRGFFIPVLVGIFLQFLIGGHQAISQGLTGSYTVGVGGDYTTFTQAVAALNSNGVVGPVTFNVLDGVYNEQILIGAITGSSAINTITFQSQNSNPQLVQLFFEAGTVDGNYVVSLEGSSNLIFKNLKIKATGTTYARTIRGQLALNNILFEGNVLESPITASTSGDRGNVIISALTSSDVRFINNTISGGSYGIFYQGTNGSGGSRSLGFVFAQNQMLDQYYRGVQISNFFEAQITDNRVVLLGSSSGSSDGYYVDEVEGVLRFTGNRVEGANQYGLYMSSCTATSGAPGLVANNQIHSKAGAYSVYFIYNNHQGFYHNNVNTTGSARALYYYGPGTTGNKIKNNIFKANTGYAIHLETAVGLDEMDYNDFFTSGVNLGRLGSSDAGDLAAWRTLSGKDANSVNADPQYASATDLTASSPALANAGIQLAEVPQDINGNSRKATPTIGANEYDAAALVPLSGIYTIDASGAGARNFTTFQQSVDAMVLNGLAGAVTFQIASGTYTEQIEIPDLSGGSASNTVTYESATGNAQDVVLTFAASTTETNYVIGFDNASDIILKNLKLVATGTTFGRTVAAWNRADNLTIEGCILQSPITNSTSFDRGNVVFIPAISSDLRVLNSTIIGGSTGIYYRGSGSGSSRGTGGEIRNNELTDQYYRGMVVQYLTGTEVTDNRVVLLGSSSGSSDGYYVDEVEGAFRFTGNRVIGANQYGLYMSSCTATSGAPGLVANNQIHSKAGAYSVYFIYNNHQGFYHNNVNTTGSARALYYYGPGTTGNKIKNNIFKANTGYAIHLETAVGLDEMDYNDFFTSGVNLGRLGSSDAGDLAAWRTLSGKDANSVNADPQYASATDLTASSPALANAGIQLAEVPQDINGNSRKATPTIGANEYDAAALVPLSGIYTIDASGAGARNFTTFQQSVDAMVLNGLAGAVTFQIASGTYTEQIEIPDLSGGSASNTVTYESATGNAQDVVLTFAASTTETNYVIGFDNASDIILKNLKLVATGTTFGRTVAAWNRADNLTIEGCILQSPITNSTSFDRGNVVFIPAISSDLRVLNSTIIGGSTGIYYRGSGSGSSRGTGGEIRNNELTDQYYRGMVVQYLTGTEITDNRVVLLNASSGSSDGYYVDEVEGAFRFTGNRVEGANQYGLYMSSCTATSGAPGLVANNQIHAKAGAYSVYFIYNTHQGFYHNNVNTTGSARAIYYYGPGTTGNKIKNNIFKANTGYAIHLETAVGIAELDYNDFFTSGVNLGRLGSSDAGDLAAWRTLSGKDLNSLSTDPQYVSATVLLAQSPSLTEAGVDLTSFVSTDIDGNPRTAPVSIGANEFAIAGVPLIGDYTLDPAGSGDRNFTSFAAASEALTLNGISGAVRFLIADGTYDGQVNLGNVSGVSDTFTITFESANANPDLVTIQHTTDYTLKLNNAEHYIFKNLTFKTAGDAQVIQVRNRAIDLLFEGLKIVSPTATGSSTTKKAIDISPSFGQNIRVLNSTITGGIYGIYFNVNGSNNRASGTVVSGNTLNDVGYRGIYLNNQLNPQVIGNTLTTSSLEDQISIYAENVSDGLLLANNRVVSGKGNALRLVNISGTASDSNLIYNNFFYSEGPNRAVYLSTSSYLKFYHNSIWNQSAGAALEYVSGGNNNKIINNIFQSGTGYALKLSTTSAIEESNFNNLFTAGSNLGVWGNTIVSN
jgi:parallel beta-helix repeat protein